MKIEFSKEWCLRMAAQEAQSTSDLDIGAGPMTKQAAPAPDPNSSPEQGSGMMKTWKICVEDGPHQSFYVETRARTLDAAIRKVQREVKKTRPWLSISISQWACYEVE